MAPCSRVGRINFHNNLCNQTVSCIFILSKRNSMTRNNVRLSTHYGKIIRRRKAYELVFERVLPYPINTVWEALTDPEKLRQWLSPNITTGKSDMQLKLGGRVKMQFMMAAPEGVISAFEPEKLLEINWGGGYVSRWELAGHGNHCKLKFTDILADGVSAEAVTAWHAYLDFLALALAGTTVPTNIPEVWSGLSASLHEHYTKMVEGMENNGHALKAIVSRSFNASPERVFDAWTTPALIEKWMFGPSVRDERVVHIRTDARKGGRFSFAVEREGETIDHTGEYLVFDRPEKLVFTWGIAGTSDDESTVAIVITATPDGCELTLTHQLDLEWADYLNRTKDAWAFMLDKLGEVIAYNKGTAV